MDLCAEVHCGEAAASQNPPHSISAIKQALRVRSQRRRGFAKRAFNELQK
jgi:hypothetical protein